jgi:hypothetical protein
MPFAVGCHKCTFLAYVLPVIRGVVIKERHKGAVGYKRHDAYSLIDKKLKSSDPEEYYYNANTYCIST